jgi:hypothetical protein
VKHRGIVLAQPDFNQVAPRAYSRDVISPEEGDGAQSDDAQALAAEALSRAFSNDPGQARAGADALVRLVEDAADLEFRSIGYSIAGSAYQRIAGADAAALSVGCLSRASDGFSTLVWNGRLELRKKWAEVVRELCGACSDRHEWVPLSELDRVAAMVGGLITGLRSTPESPLAGAASGRLGCAYIARFVAGAANGDVDPAAHQKGVAALRVADAALSDLQAVMDLGLEWDRVTVGSTLSQALAMTSESEADIAELARVVSRQFDQAVALQLVEMEVQGVRVVDTLATSLSSAIQGYIALRDLEPEQVAPLRRHTADALYKMRTLLDDSEDSALGFFEEMECVYAFQCLVQNSDFGGGREDLVARLDWQPPPVAAVYVERAMRFAELSDDAIQGVLQLLASWSAADRIGDPWADLLDVIERLPSARGVQETGLAQAVEALHEEIFAPDARRSLVGSALSLADCANHWSRDQRESTLRLIEQWHSELSAQEPDAVDLLWPMITTLQLLALEDVSRHSTIVGHAVRLRELLDRGNHLTWIDDAESDRFYAELVGVELWSRGYVAGRSGQPVPDAAMRELAARAKARIDRSSLPDDERRFISAELDRSLSPEQFEHLCARVADALARGDRNANYVFESCWTLVGRAGAEGHDLSGERGTTIAMAVDIVLETAADGQFSEAALILLPGMLEAPAARRLAISHRQRLDLLEAALRAPGAVDRSVAQPLIRAAHALRDLVFVPELWPRASQLQERTAQTVLSSTEAIAAVGPWLTAVFVAGRVNDSITTGLATTQALVARLLMAIASVIAAMETLDHEEPDPRISSTQALALVLGVLNFEGDPRAAAVDRVWSHLVGDLRALPEGHRLTPLLPVFERDWWSFRQKSGLSSADPYPESAATSDETSMAAAAAFSRLEALARLRYLASLAHGDQAFWTRAADLLPEIEGVGGAVERTECASRMLDAVIAAQGTGMAVDQLVAARIVSVATASTSSPAVPVASLGIPVLERALRVALIAQQFTKAREVLDQLRAAVNRAVLNRSGSHSVSALAVEMSGDIDIAAHEAMIVGEVELGIEIAEAGRAKVLTALGNRTPRPAPEVPDAPEFDLSLPDGNAIRHAAMGVLLSDDVLGACADIGRQFGWQQAVASLLGRWAMPTEDVESHPAPAAAHHAGGIADELRDLLIDPTIAQIRQLGSTSQVMLWCLGERDQRVTAGLLPSGSTFVTDPDLPEQAHGAAVWDLVHRQAPARPSIVVVDCSTDPSAAHRLALGIGVARSEATTAPAALLLGDRVAWEAIPESDGAAQAAVPLAPSVRLLRRMRGDRDGASQRADLERVTVLADPRRNLPGAWLEASAWASRADFATELLLGAAATRDALQTALQTSGTVVICCHGRPDTFDGVVLELSDGDLRVDDLAGMAGLGKARRVFIGACWGANIASGRVRRDALSVTTALLAQGVDELVAALAPIDDIAVAVAGAVVARGLSARRGFAETVGSARVASRQAKTRPPYERLAEFMHTDRFAPTRTLPLAPTSHVVRALAAVTHEEVTNALDALTVFGRSS